MTAHATSRMETDAAQQPAVARQIPGRAVLIAGGGIGGLATALALAKLGRNSHILEKRANFDDDGAGIQVGPNGTRILADLGIADSLAGVAVAPHALRVMDGVSGRELVRLPLGAWIAARHGAPYWTLHRADLHAALLAAVQRSPQIRLSMGMSVENIRSDEHSVECTTAAGTELSGEAAVAADGMWSALRSKLFKSRPLVFAGKCAYRAVIPSDKRPDSLARLETHIWLSPGAHVVHYPVRGGRETALVAIFQDYEAGQTWGTDVLASAVTSRANRFPDDLRQLLSVPSRWRRWSLFHAGGGAGSFAAGRIALLGDAAHPILPFMAQGGVMALEDAVVLAETLAPQPSDKAEYALRAYSSQRLRRTQRVARASQRNGDIYHLSGLFAAARNVALGTGNPQRMMGRYDWLYGWTR